VLSDETLVILLQGEPNLLVPQHASTNQSAQTVEIQIYDFLIQYNSDTGKLEPGVATEWKWLDALHMEVKIRDDVISADGTKYTADDILFTCERGVAGSAVSWWNMVDINECKVVDETTFVFGLNRPYNTYDDVLAATEAVHLISRSSVDAAGGWEACLHNPKIGTGQYTFVEWVEGNYIMLERNENYWGPKGYWKNLEFRWITDDAARAMAMQSGEADVAILLSSKQVVSLDADPSITLLRSPAYAVFTWYFNCSIEPLSDKRVREALTLLTDQDAIRQVVNGGEGINPQTNISTASPYYLQPPAGYSQKVDVARAKQLLADAGYPNGLKITLLTTAQNAACQELIQAQWALGGVDLDIQIYENATQREIMYRGEYEITAANSFNSDPMRQLNRLDGRLDPPTAAGGAQYTSTELIGYVDIARSLDPAERLRGYHLVQQYCIDNFLLLPCFETVLFNATRSDLGGARFTANGAIYVGYLRPIG